MLPEDKEKLNKIEELKSKLFNKNYLCGFFFSKIQEVFETHRVIVPTYSAYTKLCPCG